MQKLNDFASQTNGLFVNSLQEMQLAMQGILVLNETTVNNNGNYSLPKGTDKSCFTEIKKGVSTVLETTKQKWNLSRKLTA